MPYQPNQDPHTGYLTRADVCLLVEELAPRRLGKSQFYLWLEWIEEPAAEPYSNWVAAQLIRFGALLNRSARSGGTLEAARQDLRRHISSFTSESEFIEEVFHEAQIRVRPQLTWVLPQARRQAQTIEVAGRSA